MIPIENLALLVLGVLMIISSIGVIITKKPVHSSLWFLLTLVLLAALYLQLSADFIAVMQLLIYAGAILVLFMFVIVIFQDAYQKIAMVKAKSLPALLIFAACTLLLTFLLIGTKYVEHAPSSHSLASNGFGSVEALGRALYLDFFFPFEAVVLLFLIALVGALYIGRKAQ